MEDYYSLNYMQVMMYMHKIDEIRKSDPFFDESIVVIFENYVVDRTAEIAIDSVGFNPLVDKKYRITKSLFEYLNCLTGVDVFDKKEVEEFKSIYESEIEEISDEKFIRVKKRNLAN